MSGSYGTSPNFVYSGTDSKGEPYQILEILYGGIPARPAGDGLDGHSWWPLFKAVPTEYLEKYYPLRVESYSVRTDSGGPGNNRGGHGVAKIYTFLEDGLITFQDDRAQTYPVGRQRRQSRPELVQDAATARAATSWSRCRPRSRTCRCARATGLMFATAGAGGLGDPLTREPERVAKDVRAGLVSVEKAAVRTTASCSAPTARPTLPRRTPSASSAQRREPRPDFDFGPLPRARGAADADRRRAPRVRGAHGPGDRGQRAAGAPLI